MPVQGHHIRCHHLRYCRSATQTFNETASLHGCRIFAQTFINHFRLVLLVSHTSFLIRLQYLGVTNFSDQMLILLISFIVLRFILCHLGNSWNVKKLQVLHDLHTHQTWHLLSQLACSGWTSTTAGSNSCYCSATSYSQWKGVDHRTQSVTWFSHCRGIPHIYRVRKILNTPNPLTGEGDQAKLTERQPPLWICILIQFSFFIFHQSLM